MTELYSLINLLDQEEFNDFQIATSRSSFDPSAQITNDIGIDHICNQRDTFPLTLLAWKMSKIPMLVEFH
jgi:hypothetical protein